jgi:hypothetical protein
VTEAYAIETVKKADAEQETRVIHRTSNYQDAVTMFCAQVAKMAADKSVKDGEVHLLANASRKDLVFWLKNPDRDISEFADLPPQVVEELHSKIFNTTLFAAGFVLGESASKDEVNVAILAENIAIYTADLLVHKTVRAHQEQEPEA